MYRGEERYYQVHFVTVVLDEGYDLVALPHLC
jgi:hypothetical protein